MLEFKSLKNNPAQNVKEYLSFCRISRENYKDVKQFYFDLLNVITPLGKWEVAIRIIEKRYVDKDDWMLFNEIVRKFSPGLNVLCQERLFTSILSDVQSEDLKYKKGHTRQVTKDELCFICKTLCSAIYNKLRKKQEPAIRYEYFLKKKDGECFFHSFCKKFGRSIDRNKLSHCLSVLEKYKLIYREYHNSGRKVLTYIGTNNPLYLLSVFPDVPQNNDLPVMLPTAREQELLRQLKEAQEQIELLEETGQRKPYVMEYL